MSSQRCQQQLAKVAGPCAAMPIPDYSLQSSASGVGEVLGAARQRLCVNGSARRSGLRVTLCPEISEFVGGQGAAPCTVSMRLTRLTNAGMSKDSH